MCFKRLAILLCLVSGIAHAANWYVTPGGGSSTPQNGSDWNHAWAGFGGISWSSVGAGDTIWLAGGSYSGNLLYGKGGAKGSPITVKLATSSDPAPTAAPGWSPALSVPARLSGYVGFNFMSYVTLDGNSAAGPYGGIIIGPVPAGSENNVGVTAQPAGFTRSGPSHTDVTCKYVTVIGANYGGALVSTPGGTAFMFNENGQTYCTNVYIGHCFSDGCNIGVYSQGWVGGIVEYCRFNNVIGCNCSLQPHNNLWLPYDGVNMIWRYNIAYNVQGEAFEFGYIGQGEGPFSGTQIYGNVIDGGGIYGVNNFITQNSIVNFHNNTLINIGLGHQTNPNGAGPQINFPVTNNIFWGDLVSAYNQDQGQSDYNFVNNASWKGVPDTHDTLSTVNPFVNVTPGVFNTNQDYHLKSGSAPAAAGTPLATDGFLNVDMDGVVRGSGGWSIGAYQFGTAAPSTNPVAQLSTASLAFPAATLTNTSVTMPFTVANIGGGTLSGHIYGTSAPFSFVGGTNYLLTANQSATFQVKFNPTSSNSFSGSVLFSDNGGGSNLTLSVSGRSATLLSSPFAALSGNLSGWQTSGSAIYQPIEVSTIGDPAMASAYYWFSVPASTNYTVTAQGIFSTEGANSFWVNIDNPPVDPAYIWDVEPAIPVTTNALVSLRGNSGTTTDQFIPNYWFLTAGPHLLTLYGREAGAQVSQFTINGPASGVAPTLTGPIATTNDVHSGFSMSATAVGTLPVSYQWTSNGVALAGQTNSFYNAAPPSAGTNTYGCVVTNLYGSVTNTAPGVLTNGTLPTFALAPPASFSNSTNGGVILSASAIGTQPLFLQWKTNGAYIPGATNSNYSRVPAAPAFTNTYVLQASNSYGVLNSSGTVVSITNGTTAAVVTNQPQAVTNLRVVGFTLSIGADGTPPLIYQWQKNSNDIVGFTGSSMTLGPCTAADSGWYRCGVSNLFSGGFVYSQNAFVSMTNGNKPSISGPSDYTAGTNVGIQIACALTGGDSTPTFPITFQWSVLGTNILGATSTNLALPGVLAQTNTYSVIAQNFEGSVTNSAVVQITNKSLGVAPSVVSQPQGYTNSTESCYLLNLFASGSQTITYQWRKNGVTQLGYNSSSVYFCPATASQSGSWDCVLTNIAGSVTSAVASVLFTNTIVPPVAESSSSVAGQPFAYALSPVSFSSAGSYSPSGLPLSYFWSFGDGGVSASPNPRHSFRSGFYNVRMSVSDGVNPPVFSTDLSLLVMPFQAVGGSYYRKLML